MKMNNEDETYMNHLQILPKDDLLVQQMELEQGMTDLGIDRYRSRTEKAKARGSEHETAYGQTLLTQLTERVAEGVVDFIRHCEGGRPGKRHTAFKYLKMVDPRVASYLALQATLQSISRETRAQTVALRIAQMIEDEVRFREVREADRGLYNWLVEETKKRDDYRNKRAMATTVLSHREIEWEDWPLKDREHLGLKMLDIIMETVGLVETRFTSEGKHNRVVYVAPTQETLEWIERRSEAASLLAPIYEPMIVPPSPWADPFHGGYMTRFVKPLKMVKAHNRNYLEEMAANSSEMPVVYAAINAAQDTAWKVNPFILDVLNHVWEMSSTHGKVPSRYDMELPAKPHDINDNEEARVEWRRAAAKVHRENRERLSKRTQFVYALTTANKYSLFSELYFPYQFDFRGRLYAVPQLNPQGPDFMKALLHFSVGKPLTEESAPFLAIHLANCGAFEKIDKATLEDRVRWVYDHEQEIIAYANDPFGNLGWTEADSPYQFLAACNEWAGWLEEGEGFLSHLAVALDGSCSGIQHFSMALQDEVGGRAVNLVASDKPADIYTLVMEQAVAQIKPDAQAVDPEYGTPTPTAEAALQWLQSGLLTRSCFKRPTMTYGYGSREFGFRDQIMSDTLTPAYRAHQRGEGPWFFEGDGFKASLYLAKIISRAVDRVVVKAAEAMAWLKSTAQLVAAEGLPVFWTTPDGFPVLQAYPDVKPHRIETLLAGSRVVLTINQELTTVDKKAQAQGISPNFVHSLDGTHLRLTVVRASEEGYSHFALVHDSFGVHAADTPRFFQLLRETLVEMYTSCDVIESFRSEIMDQLSPKQRALLKEAPARGNLDLTSVLDSPFCFA